MTAPIALVRLIARLIRWSSKWAWRLAISPFLLLFYCLRAVTRAILATPRLIFITAPVKAYRRIAVWRDWLLQKIEFLQSESAKFRTAFSIIKSPYSFLRACGLNPQLAASLLIGTTVVGTTAITVEALSPPSFANSDPGIYAAPNDQPWYVFADDAPEHNTLLVQLTDVPVGRIVLSDTSTGTIYGGALPSGATLSLDIGGDTAAGTWLLVGHMLVDRLRCQSLLLTEIQTHTLTIDGVVSDGMSISSIPGSARKRSIIGGRSQADEMLQQSGTFDKIHITAPTAGVNGRVNELVLRNILTRDPCLFSRMKIGHLEIINSEIGGDSDLATKEFEVTDSVSAAVTNIANNVEIVTAREATVAIDQ